MMPQPRVRVPPAEFSGEQCHGHRSPKPSRAMTMPDGVVQSLGYLASILVFCAFYMRTMLPLRCVAIASNVAFIAYGVPLRLWPVVILHALLLPLNVIRLFQIQRTLTDIRAARTGDVAVHNLVAGLKRQRQMPGAVIFRKGDPGDSAYYIADGEIEFPEINTSLGRGEVFGEVGIFSPDRARTASAICRNAGVLYRIDEQSIVVAFHQNPAFAFALMRLVTKRMLERIAWLEADLAGREPQGRARPPGGTL
jgi:hypothetical protein